MKPFSAVALFASMVLLASGAAAFTLDTRTPTNPDGSAKFVDPDRQVENLTTPSVNGSAPGTTTFRSGNSTFSFGISRGDAGSGFARTSPFNNFGFNRGVSGLNRD
jgi:hypothetical protein